jgi:hypothetical protein
MQTGFLIAEKWRPTYLEVRFLENDIEQIRRIINAVAKQYHVKDGDIRFVGVEGGIVKISPSGFCWR